MPKGENRHARKGLYRIFLRERERTVYLFPYPSPAHCRQKIQARFYRSQAAVRYAAGPHGLVGQNDWYDAEGRVYIYYTVDEICADLNCGRDKAMKLLAKLDSDKGIGLIERTRQGQGKPARIYVKRFTARSVPSGFGAPVSEVDFSDMQKEVAGTHEAIIDYKTFDKVQALLKCNTRTSPEGRKVHLFSGFLKYADCGRQSLVALVKTIMCTLG